MNKCLLTFDWDWASDELTEPIIDLLIREQIPSIWFVTHPTSLLVKLKEHNELFELGIHPNFFKGSSQGNSEDEIIENLLDLVPDARCVRTHGLYQSSNLILKLGDVYNLKFDFSLFLPGCNIKPHQFKFEDKSIIRVPYNWEDDIAIFDEGGILKSYENLIELADVVFDFHPIHIALNSKDLELYNSLKNINPRVSDWTYEMCIGQLSDDRTGIGSVFRTILGEQSERFVGLDTFLK